MVTALAAPRYVLTPSEVEARARRVKIVLTDCDGVLTDGGVYYGPSGEALRRFSVRDGMGVALLRAAGVATAILTRERAEAIARRAEKLGLPHAFLGIEDKAAHLPAILKTTGFGQGDLAYIGDDVNDLGILQAVGARGLTGAPADAMAEVAATVHYRCASPGGAGAFREFAEWILRLRSTGRSERRREP